MKSNSERAAQACRVKVVMPCDFPGYPDPTTPSGWAEIPAALLAADFTGREDIEYTAMIDQTIIVVDDATLAIAEPVNGERIWLIGLRFDNDLPDLDLVGIADADTIATFAQAEIILITTEARLRQADGQVAALILTSNDPDRWTLS